MSLRPLSSSHARRLGAVPIASHQVVSQLWLLSSLVIDSVAIAGQTLVAVELGKGNVAGGRAVSDRLLQVRAAPAGRRLGVAQRGTCPALVQKPPHAWAADGM